jgi:hypothetical protein
MPHNPVSKTARFWSRGLATTQRTCAYQAHEPLAIGGVRDFFVQVLVCYRGRRDPGQKWIVHFGHYLPWNRPGGMHPAKEEPMPGVEVARGRRTTNNTELLVCI